ncbi:MAG: hypothetical protein JWQ04_2571 [Pedosphaera sp.]|nr:hypothetical protein [Pedosphaera sp.]
MKKLRSDSKWSRLPAKQREQVLKWLFDDGLSYETALRRARKQFGIKASVSSLKRFYQHVAGARQMAEAVALGGNLEDLRGAAMKILGSAALDVAMYTTRDSKALKQLVPLVKLMLQDKRQQLTEQKMVFRLGQRAAKLRKARKQSQSSPPPASARIRPHLP